MQHDKENDPDHFFERFHDHLVVKTKRHSPLKPDPLTNQHPHSICKSLDKDFALCAPKPGTIAKNDSKNKLQNRLKLVFQKPLVTKDRVNRS